MFDITKGMPPELQILLGVTVAKENRVCFSCHKLILKGDKQVKEELKYQNANRNIHYPQCAKLTWTAKNNQKY